MAPHSNGTTADDITKVLSRNADAVRLDNALKYDFVQLASAVPCEDDHAEAAFDGYHNGKWLFYGVYDGHYGSATSARLKESLIEYVCRDLKAGYDKNPEMSSEDVDRAIEEAFNRLDQDLIMAPVDLVKASQSKEMAVRELEAAIAGSCATLCFYDTSTEQLKVACVGDSRAVLGCRSGDGKWNAKDLSEDQGTFNESEVARLRKEHPGEEEALTAKDRLLGIIMVTRAFGDAHLKWPSELSTELSKKYFTRDPPGNLLTPPYLIAQPVITTTKIDTKKDNFVILASDALWETMTSEEAVALVGLWMDKQGTDKGQVKSALGDGLLVSDKRVQQRLDQWGISGVQDRFVLEDSNAAVHLARNAYGGRETDHLAGLLALRPPNCRIFRLETIHPLRFIAKRSYVATL